MSRPKAKSLTTVGNTVESYIKALTLHLGAHDILLTLELKFSQNISASDFRSAIRRVEDAIQTKYPDITRIYFEAASLSEKELKAENIKT